ncbi:uncharacterized protein [Diadema antillarum]|uniref:uncharacterized protein n=1 Tax=Diadema antillarum TaxID=105358 RepID=UPI003A8BB24F
MHRYVRLVFGIAAPFIGIPTNILICLVFIRRRPKNAVDIAIMALAVDDLISSSFNALKVPVFFSGVSDVQCAIEMVSLRSGVLTAALLTVTVAVYRFKAIVTPFSRPISPLTATWVSLGCFVFAFTYSSPFIYLSQAHEEEGKMTCVMYGDIGWIGVTYAWSQTIIFSLSSLISSVLYFKIFRVIRGQQKVRRELTAGHVVKSTQSGICSVSSSVFADNKCVPKTVDFPSDESNAETFNSFNRKDYPDDAYIQMKSNNNPVHDQTGTTTEIRALAGQSAVVAHLSTKNKKRSYNDHRTTVMLFVVSIVFFVSWLPSVALDIFVTRELRDIVLLHYEKPLLAIVVYGATQLKYINHVINAFVYAAVNRRFREDCLKAMSCK